MTRWQGEDSIRGMRTLGFGEPAWANRQSEGLGRSPEAKRNQSLSPPNLKEFRVHVGKVTRWQGVGWGRRSVAVRCISPCKLVTMSPVPLNFELGRSPEAKRNEPNSKIILPPEFPPRRFCLGALVVYLFL